MEGALYSTKPFSAFRLHIFCMSQRSWPVWGKLVGMARKPFLSLEIDGRPHRPGEKVRWSLIYPFFLFHMAAFGVSGFVLAYFADVEPVFLYLHGGIAIVVYLLFYLSLFGPDEVKWMFINAALGLYGISVEIDWLLSLFGRHVADYPWYRHVVPFLYYVLYTFLLRQAVLDLAGARGDADRQRRVNRIYGWGSLALYTVLWWVLGTG